MMGYTAPSKKAIKDGIKENATGQHVTINRFTDFRANVQETSFFGLEAKVPGVNLVVGPDAYTSRKWFANLTVNAAGIVVKVT